MGGKQKPKTKTKTTQKKPHHMKTPQNMKNFMLNFAGSAHTAVEFYTKPSCRHTTHHSVFTVCHFFGSHQKLNPQRTDIK